MTDPLLREIEENNLEWAKHLDPKVMSDLSLGQNPECLWIGCSDSRVSLSQSTGLGLGRMFVHRNIANMVIHTDSNLLSVVYFAVRVLKVEHIILCGHYNCGGIKAALSPRSYGFIDNWLTHIKDVYVMHEDELDAITDETQLQDRLAELNVQEQVANLGKISFIQQHWESHQIPAIHGYVYDIRSGLLKNLNVTIRSNSDLRTIFHVY